MKVKIKFLSSVQLFVTPWTVACQVPPSMGFNMQEHWSGLPFPSPGDLPDPGIKPRFPCDMFLNFSLKVKEKVAWLYLTLWDPMDCSLPGSSIHGIFQARTLEWVAIFFSREYLHNQILKRSPTPNN